MVNAALTRVHVRLFLVDPEFEGDSSGELVPLASSYQGVGVDFTLNVDVGVHRGVQELHSYQWLSVVHLRHRTHH